MQQWCDATMVRCNNGAMQQWCDATMVRCNNGAVQHRDDAVQHNHNANMVIWCGAT
jgi:hypothetical protein